MANGFDHITETLDENERKAMLNKVESEELEYNKSLASKEEYDKAGFLETEEKTPEELSLEALQREIKSLSFFKKLFLRILGLFGGMTLEEVYEEQQIANLKKSLVQRKDSMISSAKGDLISSNFPLQLSFVYFRAIELRPIVTSLWTNKDVLQTYYIEAVRHYVYELEMKYKITDFVSGEEIAREVVGSRDKSAVQKDLQKRINNYISKSNPKLVGRVKNGLATLQKLRDLLSFPFTDLFKLFGCEDVKEGENNHFHPHGKGGLLDYIIRLNKIDLLIGKLKYEEEALVIAFSSVRIVTSKRHSREACIRQGKEDYLVFLKLMHAWEIFSSRVPIDILMRYVKNNSHFSVSVKTRPLQITEDVIKAYKKEVIKGLDKLWEGGEEGYARDISSKLIFDLENTRLSNYSLNSGIDPGPFVSPASNFIHYHSMAMLYNFLLRHYTRNIRDITLYIAKNITAKRIPELNKKFVSNGSSYEGLKARIKELDKSLAPETETGNRLVNILYRLEKGDTQARKLLRGITELTDKEAHLISEKAHDLLGETTQLYSQVLNSENEILTAHLDDFIPKFGETKLSKLLANAVEDLSSFRDLLRLETNKELQIKEE